MLNKIILDTIESYSGDTQELCRAIAAFFMDKNVSLEESRKMLKLSKEHTVSLANIMGCIRSNDVSAQLRDLFFSCRGLSEKEIVMAILEANKMHLKEKGEAMIAVLLKDVGE